jgi:hypothetical protein
MGILSANKLSLSLVVEDSEFSHGVLVTPRINHLLYAGRMSRLEVQELFPPWPESDIC